MHKGYAFVQFTNPFDARNACHGEDGRTVLSQTLDVNMVAEPKPHQVGRKRQNITKTGNDWDYYYDSYYSSTLFRAAGARPKKRKRLMAPQARMLTDSVNNGTLNAAAVVAAAAQQQQQQHQQQQQAQQQQQQQQHHQQQHAAAAAAMAAMANLLPPQQQQLILHQQSLLSNGAAAAAAVAAAAANGMVNGVNGAGSGTTPHHSLNAFLQQQQQQHQQHQQQQHQFAGLHLKPNSPTFNIPTTAAAAIVGGGGGSSGVISTVAPPITSSGIVTNNNPMTTTATSMANCEQMSTLCVNSSSMMQQQQQLFQQQLLQVNAQQQQQQQQQQQTQWGPFKLYSNPDTLICGNCRECFSDLGELLDHKRTYCKLRFTCKCQDIALASKNPPAGTKLLCAVCKDAFTNPWDLMVHAQAAHMVNIYELGNEASVNASAANINNNNNISTNNNNNTNSINKNNKEINGISQMNGTSVTELDVCISTADIGTNSGASNGSGNTNDGKATIDLVASKVNGTLNGINGGGDHVGAGSCNNSFSGDGNVSDGDACMEINGGMMCSPNGSIPKEEIQSDGGASLDGQMSISSPTHHSDDMMKLNGSVSSRGSSPTLEALEDQPRACIVRTLSIEATSPPNATALGMMTTSLAISLTNGTATVSPTK